MSRVLLNNGAAPSTPASGKVSLFSDTTGQVFALDDTGRLTALGDSGLRGSNLIINGEFDFAQRQVPGTLTTYSQTAARGYTADRWGITNENASIQYQQADSIGAIEAGLLSRYYGKFSKITSTGKLVVSQVVEAGNCAHLRGRTVRVQMKLKASSAKTIRIVLMQLTAAGTVDVVPGYAAGAPSGTFISAFGANSTDPTFGTNLSKIAPVLTDNASSANTGLSCSVTTAWQRFGGTFLLPTDFKNLVLVVFTDSQFAAADILSMTEVGLYDGVEVREWAPGQQTGQLLNCQRYYAKSFALATLPAQNAGLTGSIRGNAAQAGAVAFVHMSIPFPVEMRVAPLVTYFNPAAANAFLRYIITPSDATATSATQVTESQTEVTATGLAAWVAGGGVAIHYTADGEL